MVIPKELAAGVKNRVAQQLTEEAASEEAEAPAEQAAPQIQAVGLREAARIAALQTELRLLGELASTQAIQGLQPYLAVNSPALSSATIVRSERDARFHVAPTELEEVLKHFGAELDKA